MLPLELISSPSGAVSSLWHESGRSRALLLGVPSVMFGVVGIVVLLWANYGLSNSLEDRYKAKLEKSSDEKSGLVETLRRELRMLQATQQSSGSDSSSEPLIPKDDPRIVELENCRSREKIYLEKLIDLNPEEPEYMYQLALVSRENGDINRCLAQMSKISPLDEPGYIKGHLWLAQYYMNAPIKTRQEALRNVSLAMEHAEQCLKRDQDNVMAKQVKGTLLFAGNGDLNEAYRLFDELFQDEPKYFKSLVAINKRLNKQDRTEVVLDSAILRFSQMLQSDDLEPAERVQLWNSLTECYTGKKQFAIAEQKLREEIKRQSELEDGSGRVWVERMLATVYVNWVGTLDLNTQAGREQHLEFLKNAYRLDPSNQNVLRQLTRLGASDDQAIAKSATQIYDPANDLDAPSSVLNEIGMQALSRSNYVAALNYFERANAKSPKNPEVLNNLAYTHTVGEKPNPRRALTLIDLALRYLPRNEQAKNYLTHFHDTRGQALMQLSRWTEAIAEFEFAIADRPDNRKILESLVTCCQAAGLDAGPWLRRLESLDNQETSDASVESKPGQ